MKINSPGLERYQSVVQAAKPAEGAAAKAAAGKAAANTDKVVISGDAAAKAELSRVSSALAAEVDGAVSGERLNELQSAVQNGSYYVASEDIADAILDVKA